jgi:hypothetical protein
MAINLASELLEAIGIDPQYVMRAVINIEKPHSLRVDVEYLVVKNNANFDGVKKLRKKNHRSRIRRRRKCTSAEKS